jgi:putative addiction module component (TIGR02574 family)
MSMTLDEIATQALQLTPWERIELAVHLLIRQAADAGEADDGLSRAWAAEVDRRTSDLASGRTVELPSKEFLDMLRIHIDAARAGNSQSGADREG